MAPINWRWQLVEIEDRLSDITCGSVLMTSEKAVSLFPYGHKSYKFDKNKNNIELD